MIPLRPYQTRLTAAIRAAWAAGHRNVLAVQATRTGKTVVFSDIIANFNTPAVAIAHRQELIGQMSVALARCGVRHRILAPATLIKRIIKQHVAETGISHYDPRALCAVASVDTLLRRVDELAAWFARIELWVVDESHHIADDNKWMKAVALFPNARGLGVTATPKRADGKGLGRHADGVFDDMVVGIQAREAIAEGWLLAPKIYAPIGDYHRPDDTERAANGDFKPTAIKKSIRNSHIVGDIVTHYHRLVPGKTAVVFAPDVETGKDIAAKFVASSVQAEIVSAKTPDKQRAATMARFKKRQTMVLVNVDLFGEGTDLPDLEVVIMARPTESFALFVQQTARSSTLALDGPIPETREGRLAAIAASRKPYAIIIDHVGNVARHATAVEVNSEVIIDLAHADWSLDAAERRGRGRPDDAIPLRNCLNPECLQVYERIYPACPYCGDKPVPASRSAPEFVDGDLTELDPLALAVLRGAVEKIDTPVDEYRARLQAEYCRPIGIIYNVKHHIARQDAQKALRESMAWWAGHQRAAGRTDAQSYRLFWFKFGIDALSAQALGATEAIELAERINNSITTIDGRVNSC